MATIRRFFSVIGLFGAALLAPVVAHAATAECMNDTDCPGSECGGEICDWSTLPQTCKPAGTYPKGQDGWCTSTANCKCAAEGATCVSVQCSQTQPAGTTGIGGGSSTGGSASSGGSATAGSSAAGTTSAAAGSSTAGSTSSGSSCSMSGAPMGSTGSGVGLGVVCAGLLVVGARRRKRAAA
jgi:hypothetical protein